MTKDNCKTFKHVGFSQHNDCHIYVPVYLTFLRMVDYDFDMYVDYGMLLQLIWVYICM